LIFWHTVLGPAYSAFSAGPYNGGQPLALPSFIGEYASSARMLSRKARRFSFSRARAHVGSFVRLAGWKYRSESSPQVWCRRKGRLRWSRATSVRMICSRCSEPGRQSVLSRAGRRFSSISRVSLLVCRMSFTCGRYAAASLCGLPPRWPRLAGTPPAGKRGRVVSGGGATRLLFSPGEKALRVVSGGGATWLLFKPGEGRGGGVCACSSGRARTHHSTVANNHPLGRGPLAHRMLTTLVRPTG
jgi:hypothetical protein